MCLCLDTTLAEMKLFFHFVIIAVWVSAVRCARRVDAKEQLEKSLASLGGSTHRAKREARRLSVRDLMGAGPETDLQVTGTSRTVQGTRLWKMGETFRGREVYDAQLTVETDADGDHVLDATGSFVQDIEEDTDGSVDVYTNEALDNVLLEFGDNKDLAKDVLVDLKIFIDENGEAFSGYLVEYRIEEEGQPRRPTAIVDGRDGHVMMKWNSMTTFCPDAQGVGGNEKTGEVLYNGLDPYCLDVTERDGVCYLENEHVRVVNMGGERLYNITQTMSYDCHNATDGINGAYSPALDAFYIGTQAYKMFREWYDMSPVTNEKLIIRVHFGTNYPNAYWNGVNATFGDGRGSFHPFVSVDLVGHEIGHALIEQNSGLIWYQQPGGVNEAFADITGEVLEHYIKGEDWLTGADITKNDDAVRYFINPEDNYISIGSMDDYINYMEPHETGGILAHAFYRLVALHGQPIKEAYRVFLHANKMYWHHMSSMKSAACELMKSAYDLGQPGDVYKQALEHVGIEVCDIADHVVGLRSNQTYSDIQLSNATRPVFTFGVPGEWTNTVYVRASSSHGDVHISISDKTWMTAYDPAATDTLAEGYSHAAFTVTDITLYYVTITLSSDSPEMWNDVTLEAGFTCVAANQTSHGYFEHLRKENCEGRSY